MPSDDNRVLRLTQQLGGKEALVRNMTGTERLGELFEYELEVVSENLSLTPQDVLGKEVSLSLEVANGGTRYFHGVICEFALGGAVRVAGAGDGSEEMASYRLVLRPWAWLLSRRADSTIYQDKNVPDIIKQVFRDEGYSDFEVSLTKTYDAWTYCVQYRETHLNFVSRLMEQLGIYYYFKHSESKHDLVMVDDAGAHSSASGYSEVTCVQPGFNDQAVDCVTDVSVRRGIQPGRYSLKDFNFETPSTDLLVKSSKSSHGHKGDAFEVYDYPGEYDKSAAGKAYATVRFEELQARYEVFTLDGTVLGVGVGNTFTLAEAANRYYNREYLVIGASYVYRNNGLFAGNAGDPPEFNCRLEAIDSQVQYRPPRNTFKPAVQGPQTAIVVGPSGEDIWTDKYSRVKCQFHWDRQGKSDENSSCWIRVAQVWAGKGWGGMQIPRIGQEVIVDFLEGDPDQPIITGRVYNAEQMPPYKLPDHATKSGIKSQSTPDGTLQLFNEIRFDDKKDAEEIYVHAERDYNRVVENNDTLKVGFDHKNKGDQTIDVHNNQTITIGNSDSDDGSQKLTIWKDRTTQLEKGNDKLTVAEGDRTITVKKGDDKLTITTGKRTVKIKGDLTQTVEKGNRKVEIKMGDDKLIVGMGNRNTDVKLGKHVTKAMQSIELKVGGNSLKIDQSGITMKGIMVKIQGNAMLDLKAPMTSVKGMGMLTLKGGMTMIN
ncbi:MAG: type VI secretion system tip protein VgrG [Pseudomonadota bacterium]